MFSPNYQIKTKDKSELLEYSRNMVETLLEYQNRWNPIETVLAMDGFENWRLPLYDAHYHDAVDYWKHNSEKDQWVVLVDNVHYMVRRNQATRQWFVDKMSKDQKDVVVPTLEDYDMWLYFEKGQTPQWLLDEYPDLEKHATEFEAWDGLTLAVPTYKGNRIGSKFPGKTPKPVWKKYSRNLAYNISHLFGAREVLVESAEGDDIIATYIMKMAEEHPEDRIILVTKDRDLDQLRLKNPNLLIYNLQYNEYVDDTLDMTRQKLVSKFIGGDGSDNIKGCVVVGDKEKQFKELGLKIAPKAAVLGPIDWFPNCTIKSGKQTDKWLRTIQEAVGYDWGQVFDVLDVVLDQASYEKNLHLIHLDNIPEDVTNDILAKLEDLEPIETEKTFEDVKLSPGQKLIVENRGKTLRAMDELVTRQYGEEYPTREGDDA